MKAYQYHFHRTEKKYLLTEEQYRALMSAIYSYLEYDQYKQYKICNIYFDTPEFDLIRHSIEKPLYKEKLRLRSYGIPEDDSLVHLEIKKKYKGTVYKRRISMPYRQALNYCIFGEQPEQDSQILKEVDWMFSRYDLYPMLYLSYDRLAMRGIAEPRLRITFDHNLLWRVNEMDLAKGSFGNMFFNEQRYIMEVKTDGAMPLWLSQALNTLKIYPSSFSKYGSIYQKEITKIKDYGGIESC